MTQTSRSKEAIFELTMSPAQAGQVAKGIKLYLISPHPYIDTSAAHREIALEMLTRIIEYLASEIRTKFFFFKMYTSDEKSQMADVLNHAMRDETHTTVLDRIREQLFGAGEDSMFDNATSP